MSRVLMYRLLPLLVHGINRTTLFFKGKIQDQSMTPTDQCIAYHRELELIRRNRRLQIDKILRFYYDQGLPLCANAEQRALSIDSNSHNLLGPPPPPRLSVEEVDGLFFQHTGHQTEPSGPWNRDWWQLREWGQGILTTVETLNVFYHYLKEKNTLPSHGRCGVWMICVDDYSEREREIGWDLDCYYLRFSPSKHSDYGFSLGKKSQRSRFHNIGALPRVMPPPVTQRRRHRRTTGQQ